MNSKSILKYAVAFALLGYIIFINDLSLVAENFMKIPAWVWVSCILLTAITTIISSLRLYLFFQNRKFETFLYLRLASVAYGLILPGQIAVEGIRAYMLAGDDRKYSKPGAAIIVDKMLGLLSITLLGLVGLFFTVNIYGGFSILFIFGAMLILLMLIFPSLKIVNEKICKILAGFTNKSHWLDKLLGFGINTTFALREYSSNSKLMLSNFALALLFNFFSVCIGVLLTHSIGIGLHTVDWLWIHAVYAFLLSLPITIGGFGVREGGLIGLLAVIGATSEQALAVSFVFLALTLMQAVVGVILMMVKVARDK